MISKRTWRIFLIILVISLPIRLYQALFLLEPGTGFYSDGYLSTAALLIVLMAGCALLCAETAREKQMVPRLPVRSLAAAVGLRVPRGAVSFLFRNGEYGRQCV